MTQSILFIFTAFGAGLLSSLSPCVYPIIPITVGFLGPCEIQECGYGRLVSFAVGQVLTLLVLGILAVSLGESMGFSAQVKSVRFLVGIFLILAGIVSWVGHLPRGLSNWNKAVHHFLPKDSIGIFGAFFLGSASAAVLSPCTSPILGSVLTMIASDHTLLGGLLSMLAYSVGFSVVFLLLGFGLTKVPRSGKWMNAIHKGGAVVLFVMGAWQILH